VPGLVLSFLRRTKFRNDLGVMSILLSNLKFFGRFVEVLLLLLLLPPLLIG
jgi:hypothetical protein